MTWVETGTPPQNAGDSTNLGILATGAGIFGTRPVCPWPTTAVWNGTGATNVASSYNCQGNIDANVTGIGSSAPAGTASVSGPELNSGGANFPPTGTPVTCLMLHTIYGQENSGAPDYAASGIPATCPRHY